MSNKKIGITSRIVNASNYDEQRDALSQDWPPFLEKINLTPIFIPNSLDDTIKFLDEIEVDDYEFWHMNMDYNNQLNIVDIVRLVTFILNM